MKRHISPKDLSAAVGVSESSLKRWVDDGVLRASRTAGGHRRITISEAVRFIRKTGLRLLEPGALGLPDLDVGDVKQHMAETAHTRLSQAMVAGDGPLVTSMILGAYLGGQTVAAIFDQLVAPALHEMGELWRHDAKGIFVEHRATVLCIEAIHQLRALLPAASADAPTAVGGALSGDIYTIPTLMAATLLAEGGWNETNLGADTPVDSLMHARDAAKAKLVWVSISVDLPEQQLARQLTTLAQRLAKADARLIVGGRCVPAATMAQFAHVHMAGSMSDLASYAAGLRAAL